MQTNGPFNVTKSVYNEYFLLLLLIIHEKFTYNVNMIVNELAEFINGKIITGNVEHKIISAFASDLMSDVLTMDDEDVVLITGLCTQQVIRTAEMSDIQTVIFARGKTITQDIIDLAKENEITLIASELSIFKLCGMLYGKLNPVY